MKPKLRAIAQLRCPLCLETPLRQRRSWLTFYDGCPRCRYLFDREPGYFWGAAWMINYPLTAILTIIAGILLFKSGEVSNSLVLAALISLVAVVFALLIFPFCRAAWMFGDLWVHPLTDEDHKNFERKQA